MNKKRLKKILNCILLPITLPISLVVASAAIIYCLIDMFMEMNIVVWVFNFIYFVFGIIPLAIIMSLHFFGSDMEVTGDENNLSITITEEDEN